MAISAPFVCQSDYSRDMEKFVATSSSLVLLVDFNVICDARVNHVGSKKYKGNVDLQDLLSRFQLTDPYRLELPNALLGTWSSSNRPFRTCLDGISIRNVEKNIAKCPQSHSVCHNDHKLGTCELNLDIVDVYKKSGNGKFNKSLSVIGEYRDRIKLLLQKPLTETIINDK